MIAEMREANDVAAENGWRGWPDDEPEEHPNEYVGVLIDNYYDLWAVHPTKYEGRDIEPGDIPEGHSHFGRYFANARAKVSAQDPLGYAVIEKFFHPYLTYTPKLPADFSGTFSMELDEERGVHVQDAASRERDAHRQQWMPGCTATAMTTR